MAIRVLFATAHRQTLTIQHENPFGDCFTEYDLDEYTAQDAAKTGREPFLTIRAAQWRAVCRDLLTPARSIQSRSTRRLCVSQALPPVKSSLRNEKKSFCAARSKTDTRRKRRRPKPAPSFLRLPNRCSVSTAAKRWMISPRISPFAASPWTTSPKPLPSDHFNHRSAGGSRHEIL